MSAEKESEMSGLNSPSIKGPFPTPPQKVGLKGKSTPPIQKNSAKGQSTQIPRASKESESTGNPSNNAPSQAEGPEAEDLAEVLDRLQIAEENLVAKEENENEKAKDESAQESTLFETFRSRLRSGRSPKQALEPILEAFDLEGVAKFIKAGKAKKIIVMSGAGISVSAGIPDFRSPETGLYANLQKFNLPHPQAVFELDFFRKDPQPFYLLAKELFPGRYKPTPAHYFVKLLDEKGLLLRAFTQNIDSLEREAGLPSHRLVAAHGNFDQAHCIECYKEVSQDTVREAVNSGQICTCSSCGGYVKPDIVFFGENLPELFFRRAQKDFPKADLLIVMGTSLVVHPFASLIDRVGSQVPRILINRERVGEADAALALLGYNRGFKFDSPHRDALYIGDCDEGVKALASLLGWEKELQALIDEPARL